MIKEVACDICHDLHLTASVSPPDSKISKEKNDCTFVTSKFRFRNVPSKEKPHGTAEQIRSEPSWKSALRTTRKNSEVFGNFRETFRDQHGGRE